MHARFYFRKTCVVFLNGKQGSRRRAEQQRQKHAPKARVRMLDSDPTGRGGVTVQIARGPIRGLGFVGSFLVGKVAHGLNFHRELNICNLLEPC